MSTARSESSERTRRPHLVGFGVVWALACLVLGLELRGQTFDDAYITYRYAQNVADGHGLVYVSGERDLGSTAPGLALVLGAAHRLIGVDVPTLGTFTTVACLWLLAMVVARDGRSVAASGLAGSLIVGSALFWVHNGSEQFPLLLMLALSAVAPHPAVAGGLGGLAVWVRPDAVVGIAIVGLLRFARRATLRRLGAFLASAAVPVVLGVTLASAYFGAPLPGTLEAKRLQAELGMPFWHSGVAYVPELVRRLGLSVYGAWTLPVLGLAALGAVRLARPAPGAIVGRTLCLYAGAQLLAYVVLGVPFYTWYAIPTVVALHLLLASGVGWCAEAVAVRMSGADDGTSGSSHRALGAAVLVWLLLAPVWSSPLVGLVRGLVGFQGVARVAEYTALAEWLSRHGAPEDEVYFTEVGLLGFGSGLRMLDPLGLVTPEARPYLAERDLVGLFLASRPRYVVDHPDQRTLQRPVLEHPTFIESYSVVHRQPLRDGRWIELYERAGP